MDACLPTDDHFPLLYTESRFHQENLNNTSAGVEPDSPENTDRLPTGEPSLTSRNVFNVRSYDSDMRTRRDAPPTISRADARAYFDNAEGMLSQVDGSFLEITVHHTDSNMYPKMPGMKSNCVNSSAKDESIGGHANKIFNDELRFSIIDAVYLRPAIWDHGRGLKSLGRRKDHFIEVAALLSTEDNILSCQDVERQWKNLKDTYMKLRKKVKYDSSGAIIQPRWKYFSAMMFLDQLNSSSSEASISSQASSPIGHNRQQITASRSVSPAKMNAGGREGISSGSDGHLTNTSSDSSPRIMEDEYIAFCNSLVFPLREIGSKSRMEFLKLQKKIRDTVHEKQMELLQVEKQ